MSINMRPGSPFWYIQFQYNGHTYIKSSKTTDKKLASKLETQWRSQLIEQQQLGVKQVLSVKEAFQLYSTSKRSLVSAYNVELWCSRSIKYFSSKAYIHEIDTIDIERVDSGDKLIHHSGPILSHLVRDKFGYSVVDKSTSLACS